MGEGEDTGVEGDQADAAPAGECQQMGVGHLAITDDQRNIVIDERYVVSQEAVASHGA